MNPKLLVLDEPFESLDPRSKQEMVKRLKEINQQYKTTMIITTHDINLVPEIADLIYVVDQGHVVAKGNYQEVFSNYEGMIKANLDIPILMELFSRLNRKGYSLKITKKCGRGGKTIVGSHKSKIKPLSNLDKGFS